MIFGEDRNRALSCRLCHSSRQSGLHAFTCPGMLDVTRANADKNALTVDEVMGICNTKPADERARAPAPAEQKFSELEKPAVSEETEAEFLWVLKKVTILILDRLTNALTSERWAYNKIAVGMGDTHYMDLMLYTQWKKLLSDLFEVDSFDEKAGDEEFIHLQAEDFRVFLSKVGDKKPSTTRAGMIKDIQDLAAQTQNKLQKAKEAATASDLKMFCIFFINSLDTLKGNIGETKGLLVKNVQNFSTQGKAQD